MMFRLPIYWVADPHHVATELMSSCCRLNRRHETAAYSGNSTSRAVAQRATAVGALGGTWVALAGAVGQALAVVGAVPGAQRRRALVGPPRGHLHPRRLLQVQVVVEHAHVVPVARPGPSQVGPVSEMGPTERVAVGHMWRSLSAGAICCGTSRRTPTERKSRQDGGISHGLSRHAASAEGPCKMECVHGS